MLLASLIAGFLWEQIGPSATFIAGAAFTALRPLRPFPHPPGQPSHMTGIQAKPLFNLTPTAASARRLGHSLPIDDLHGTSALTPTSEV